MSAPRLLRDNSSWRACAGGGLVEVTKPRQIVLDGPGSPSQLHTPKGADVERAERADAAPLGNNADFAPPPPPAPVVSVLPPSTVKAYHLRSVGRQILGKVCFEKRIRWCGSKISKRLDGVGIYARPDRAYGRVHGVCVCGQSLACPVCAPRIAAFRAEEVAEAFRRAAALGFESWLCTYTQPHDKGSTLGFEVDQFGQAWRSFNKGKAADKLRAYALGHHVGREVTFGDRSGWHYHHHQLRHEQPGKFDPERTKYYWLAALESIGRRTRGVDTHAFDSGLVTDAQRAAYCAKLATSVEAQARSVGSEIASASTKGRNLATLLLEASQGDTRAAKIWLHGVTAITERKISSVRWSRGLRAKLGMEVEKDDETVAKEEALPSDVFLGALTPMQWRGVLAHRAEFSLLFAANQGVDAVNNFLAGLELGQLNDDPRPGVVVSQKDDSVYRDFAPSRFLPGKVG